MNKFKYFLYALLVITATVAFGAAVDKYISSQGNIIIKTAANKTVGIQESLYTKQTGEVGIGTNVPTSKLDVEGSNGSTAIHINDTSANSTPQLLLINDAQTWIIRNNGADSDKLIFRNGTTDTTNMVIQTDGKVGIGYSQPNAMLHVQTTNKGIWSERNNSSSTTKGLTNDANLVLQGWYNAGNHAQILFGSIATYGTAAIGSEIVNNSGSQTAALWFATRNVTTDTAPVERMRINPNGNITSSIIGDFGGVRVTRVSAGTTGYYYVDTGIVCNKIGVYEVSGIIMTNIGSSFPYSSGFNGTIIVNGVYSSQAGYMAKWTTVSNYNGTGTTPISGFATNWYNGSTILSATDAVLCPNGTETIVLALTITGIGGSNMNGAVNVRRAVGNEF